MTIHEASRTLLKSPPELWAECSEATSLNRHLDQFGEIRITRLEPETAVAWEGDNASGTVRLEPSGWGTRVILTAQEVDPVVEQSSPPVSASQESRAAVVQAQPEPEPAVVEPEPEPEPEPAPQPQAVEPEPEPAVAPEPEPAPEPGPPPVRGGFFARLMARMRGPVPVVEQPTTRPMAEPEPVVEPEPQAVEPEPQAVEPEPQAVEPKPQAVGPEPVAKPEPGAQAPAPEPAPRASEPTPAAPLKALTGALDSLGMAHHRPFSRS